MIQAIIIKPHSMVVHIDERIGDEEITIIVDGKDVDKVKAMLEVACEEFASVSIYIPGRKS